MILLPTCGPLMINLKAVNRPKEVRKHSTCLIAQAVVKPIL